MKEKSLKNILLRLMKLNLIFMSIMEKIQVDENGCKYILFTSVAYFTEYLLAVEVDEKGHTDRDFIFEEKRQKALDKNLGCKFFRINTSKERYNAEYEASRVQEFIFEFKDKQLKKLEKESNKKIKSK